jgi:DNA-binding IclR family transcriptional regulator
MMDDVRAAMVSDPAQFTDAERAILWMLARGRCTPSYLAAELELTPEYCRERLVSLQDAGYVERIHRGLYAVAG